MSVHNTANMSAVAPRRMIDMSGNFEISGHPCYNLNYEGSLEQHRAEVPGRVL